MPPPLSVPGVYKVLWTTREGEGKGVSTCSLTQEVCCCAHVGGHRGLGGFFQRI